MIRSLARFTAPLLLTVLLAACATPTGGGPNPPPSPGQIDIGTSVPGNTLTIAASSTLDFVVGVTLGSGFEGTVLVEHGDLPGGFSLLHGGLPLNDVDLELSASGDVTLTLATDAAPEDSDNLFFDVFAQGLDERGRTRNQPRDQVGFSVVLE